MNKMSHFLLYFLCARIAIASPETLTDSAENVFAFVNDARNNLKLTTNPNIILVVGNTGCGKSTLIHYVAGDYSKMLAVEPIGHGSEYKIYDGLDTEIENMATSTVSRTLVPEMQLDEEGNVWYDCPGFADTRNETVEIATTFLIKSVIENAKKIKMVLVVNYESVTDGHDRQDFDQSLSRVTELIQNIKRFENSVSLVVTKAPSYYIRGKSIIEIFEDSLKNSTAQFVSDHRSVLQNKGSNEKKVQLIDGLLKQSSTGDYPRIAIFWRPMEDGSFDKIDKMITARQTIRETILEQTSYADFDESDFGFPLSAETKLKITDIARHTIHEITVILSNIDKKALSGVQIRIGSVASIQNKFALLEIGQNGIRSFNEIESVTLKQWTDHFKFLIETFGVESIDLQEFDQIKRHEDNLDILKSIAGIEIGSPIRDSIASSLNTNFHVSIEYKWLSFLVQIFDFLISFEVQKDVTAYDVANLLDWGQLNKPQGLTIDENNFIEFTKRFPGRWETSNPTPSSSKLNELNEILAKTLKSPPEYECLGETMIVRGPFVKSSDIQTKKCPQIMHFKTIAVYVTSIFYVHSHLVCTGNDELKIFAPKWSIQHEVTFNLNGRSGAPQAPPQASGTAGRPGNVGLNAGNFFGFATEIVNGELLTVNLNGGNGGSGQDGTTNQDVAIQFNNFEDRDTVYLSNFVSVDARCQQVLRGKGYDVENIGAKIYRLHSHCCGSTGKGGQGGLGGHPGTYNFELISDPNHTYNVPKLNAQSGSVGGHGRDANACKSLAVDIHINDWMQSFGVKRRARKINYTFSHHINEPRCPDNFIGTAEPIRQPNSRNPLSVASEINEYKKILLQSTTNLAVGSVAQKTLDAIKSSPSKFT